jgi:transcription termination/antitermination protein NusA
MAQPLRKEEFPEKRSGQPAGENSSHSLRHELDKLAAETGEEVDALRIDLLQEDEPASTSDGTGRIVDELAEEKIAQFTEVGPLSAERGAESIAPGRDDPSRILRQHHPNTAVARAEDVVEGNLDEPADESTIERDVDEGTAA